MNHRRSHRIYGGPAGRRAGSVPTDRHAVLYRLDHNGVTLDDVAGSANAKLIGMPESNRLPWPYTKSLTAQENT